MNSTHGNEPYILIEGPKWGDAEFYGNWLLMAAKAEALWKEAVNDPSFDDQVMRLMVADIPDFGMGATDMLMSSNQFCRLRNPAKRRGNMGD